MSKHRTRVAGVAIVLLTGLAWWFFRSGPMAEQTHNTSTTSSGRKTTKPHFPSRSTRSSAVATDAKRAQPDQDSVALAYPEGLWLTCPAPGLANGEYRVHRSLLRHLSVMNEELSGVLTKPSEGHGFLVTPRGHHTAELRWSEQGCQLQPLQPMSLAGSGRRAGCQRGGGRVCR